MSGSWKAGTVKYEFRQPVDVSVVEVMRLELSSYPVCVPLLILVHLFQPIRVVSVEKVIE